MQAEHCICSKEILKERKIERIGKKGCAVLQCPSPAPTMIPSSTVTCTILGEVDCLWTQFTNPTLSYSPWGRCHSCRRPLLPQRMLLAFCRARGTLVAAAKTPVTQMTLSWFQPNFQVRSHYIGRQPHSICWGTIKVCQTTGYMHIHVGTGFSLTPYGQLERVPRALSLLGRMSSPQVCLESPMPKFQSIKKKGTWMYIYTQYKGGPEGLPSQCHCFGVDCPHTGTPKSHCISK